MGETGDGPLSPLTTMETGDGPLSPRMAFL